MFRCVAAVALCARLLLGTPQTSFPVPPPRLPTRAEAFHAAIRIGNLEEAQRLLAAGADVNAPDYAGNTPLLYAAWEGNAETTAFLLGHGADPNFKQAGPTPLGAAVAAGKTAVVEILVSAGARVDVRYRDDRTPLQLAALNGFDQIAELLLKAGADVAATDATDHTALDDAVLSARASVIPVLLRHGAGPRRVRSQDGRGPLAEAGLKGNAAIVNLLVSAGADPAARDNFGQTPLDLALAYKNRAAISAYLRLAQDRPDCRAAADHAMETATLRGRLQLVQLLLDAGFDLNRADPGASPYLHQAALKGHAKIVQLLLARGADANALDGNGSTPLHNAASGGSTDVITVLLDRGARIDAAERNSGATPLMLAASLSRTAAVALLLARGADPGLRDSSGHTALDRARETDDNPTIKLLETALGAATAGRKAAA